MKTTIHTYCFDISKPAEKAAYESLAASLKKQGLKVFETWGLGSGHYHPFSAYDGAEIELETSSLFNNQWNTAPCMGSEKGWRVFDWAQDYPINFSDKIKRGHYLAQTPEMGEIRRNTCACGYCGKQEPAAKGYTFCPHCLDSEYLKESDLELLRMVPVRDSNKPRKPLSKAERDYLLPLYREAQLHGTTERGKARIAKEKQEIESDYKKTVANAKAERDAKRWIVNTCPGMLSQYIYYSHRGTHAFGWRGNGLGKEQVSALLDVISEFPFGYEIRCDDGRVLKAEN